MTTPTHAPDTTEHTDPLMQIRDMRYVQVLGHDQDVFGINMRPGQFQELRTNPSTAPGYLRGHRIEVSGVSDEVRIQLEQYGIPRHRSLLLIFGEDTPREVIAGLQEILEQID